MSLLSTRRRLAARTLAQQASRCACCEDAPPPVPLGAFLLAATELPQVALARLEQRGDVHLALGRRRHRRPRDQLSARGVRLTDTLRDPPMFTSAGPRYTRDVTDRYASEKTVYTSAGSAPQITRPILQQLNQAWPHAAELQGACSLPRPTSQSRRAGLCLPSVGCAWACFLRV